MLQLKRVFFEFRRPQKFRRLGGLKKCTAIGD